jgi:hypothetical protein
MQGSAARPADFLKIPKILEVSIGHAFVVECLEHGIESVMQRYLKIVNNSAQAAAMNALVSCSYTHSRQVGLSIP